MAVVEELFNIGEISHVRHYSDSNLMIASDDGVEYEIAEDLFSLGKVYHETNTPVPGDESEAEEILNILTGGET